MQVLYLVLFCLAAICFLFGVYQHPAIKANLIAAGLFLWVLVYVIKAAVGLPG